MAYSASPLCRVSFMRRTRASSEGREKFSDSLDIAGVLGGGFVALQSLSVFKGKDYGKARMAAIGTLVLPIVGLTGGITAFALVPIGAAAWWLLRQPAWQAGFASSRRSRRLKCYRRKRVNPRRQRRSRRKSRRATSQFPVKQRAGEAGYRICQVIGRRPEPEAPDFTRQRDLIQLIVRASR